MELYVYSLKSSKTKKEIIDYIEDELKKIYQDIKFVALDSFLSMDLKDVSIVIISGGDGTFTRAINKCALYPNITLGYIPLGTANDMGRNLGIKNYKDALKKIKNGFIKKYNLLDVIEDNKHIYFNYAFCFGNMAKVSTNAKIENKKRLSKFDYLLRGCKLLFCKKEKVTAVINGKEVTRKVRALIVFRSKYLGGYRIKWKKDDKMRIAFISNIFALGFMFILNIPIAKVIRNVQIKSDAISSYDGENGNFKNVLINVSDKEVKIFT